MLIEVELNLLVGDVNAELLERVALEVFKAEDVQDADVLFLVLLPESGRRTRQEKEMNGFRKASYSS